MPDSPETDISYAIPKNASDAVAMIQKTAEINGEMPFWRPNHGSWKSLLPPGVRPYPEVAIMDTSPQYVRNDYVMLKYLDGVKATIGTDKLYKGHVIYPCDVTKKWLVVKDGEKNIRNRLVGGEDA